MLLHARVWVGGVVARNRNALQANCPWLLRYIVVAYVLRRRNALPAILALIKEETYRDPVCSLAAVCPCAVLSCAVSIVVALQSFGVGAPLWSSHCGIFGASCCPFVF